MKTRMIIFLAMIAGVVSAAEMTLEDLMIDYGGAIVKIQAEREDTVKSLNVSYANVLGRAVEALKKQGDPDPVRLGMAEIARFNAEKTVPSIPATNLPPAIQDVQYRYGVALDIATVCEGRKMLDVTKQYVSSLDKMMRQYTASGNLDAAMRVKEEKTKFDKIIASTEEKIKGLTPVPVLEKKAVTISSDHNPGAGREITIDAKSEHGIDLGDVRKGQKVTLRYISGTWSYGGDMGSPDENSCPIAISSFESGKEEIITTVPRGTAKNPFEYRFQKPYQKVVVKIADDNLHDNRGKVEYRMFLK